MALESLTTTAIALAMDAASLRHQAIAANVANHGTAGYVPLKLDFASQMDEARRAIHSGGKLTAAALRDVKPELAPVLDESGLPARVHLDEQMADMAANAVQYQALTRGLARHFAILSLAVNDGKR